MGTHREQGRTQRQFIGRRSSGVGRRMRRERESGGVAWKSCGRRRCDFSVIHPLDAPRGSHEAVEIKLSSLIFFVASFQCHLRFCAPLLPRSFLSGSLILSRIALGSCDSPFYDRLIKLFVFDFCENLIFFFFEK